MEQNPVSAMLKILPQSPALTIETPERITLTYFLQEGVLDVEFPDGDRATRPMNLLAAVNLIAKLRVEGTLTIPDEKIDAFLRGVDDTLDAGDGLLDAIRDASAGEQR